MSRDATWQNPRILSTLLLIFLCGAMAGALAMRLTGRGFTKPGGGGHNVNLGTILPKLEKDLELRPQQSEQIRQILDDYSKMMQDLHEQENSVRADGKARVMQVLDPDQRRKYEKMVNDMLKAR